jgi:Zn-dependent metalloprotease
MHCNIIPDHILKLIKDRRSLKLSQKIRGLRNRLFSPKPAPAQSSRLTYDTHSTTKLPGEEVARDNDITKKADDLAFIAHVGADQYHRWLLNTFGRNSYDNKGATFLSTVHYGKDYSNAFWNGVQMVFGDSDGKFFLPLVKSDDVRGHEQTHALVEHTAGLVYYSQPGALNESFADMFGIAFKHYLRNSSDPNKASWLLGDDIVGPEFPGLAIRSFKNEKAYKTDPQPKHMKNYSWTLSDNQGVHINSGIISHSFYHLCILSGKASFREPIQIMYKVLLKLGKYSGFKTFAKTAREVSKDFGADWADYTDKALKEVGL